METLLLNPRTKNDVSKILELAKNNGIDLRLAQKKISKQKLIAELSKSTNKALFNKYVKPVLDDNNNR